MTKDNHQLGRFNLEGIPPAPRGVPQIEVTFDVDANGILNVSALEKGTGKTTSITITNDTARLSKAEIEKMISDAEKFKAEDELIRKRVDARNGLESYCFQMKNTLNEEKLKAQFTDDDKKNIEETTNDCLRWLEGNSEADTDAIEEKKKEVEAKLNPIMMRIYQATGGAGMPQEGRMPSGPGTEQAGPAPSGGAAADVDDLD